MIKQVITIDTLRDRNACREGIEEFIKYFPSGVFEYTNSWSPWITRCLLETPLNKYIGWLRVQGLLPVISLERWCLEGANLYRADLEGANLRGADLREAHLYRANLRGANLRGADLKEANLKEANLYRANLKEAER